MKEIAFDHRKWGPGTCITKGTNEPKRHLHTPRETSNQRPAGLDLPKLQAKARGTVGYIRCTVQYLGLATQS